MRGTNRRPAIALLTFLWLASSACAAEADSPTGGDVLAEARAMNSAEHAPPPSEWRSGEAHLQKLTADRVEPREKGFEIRLPSGAPVPSPAVHEGVLVTSGGFHSREIHAFDAQTGKPLWGLALSDDGPSSPACQRGVCVWNTESCTIFGVRARTGELLWSHYLGDPQLSAPAIGGDRVFTVYPAHVGQSQPPGASHVLAALDLESGRLLWQRWIDGDAISAPVAAEGEVHLSSMSGTLYRLRQSDGEILAARRARATSAPVVVGGEVYYSKRADSEADAGAQESLIKETKHAPGSGLEFGRKRALYLDAEVQRQSALAARGKSLDASNGFASGPPDSAKAADAESNLGQASVSTLQAFQGSRVLQLADRTVATMGDEVVASDGKTGKALWKRKLAGDLAQSGGALAAPPASAGGYVVLGTLDGAVELLDPSSGEVARRYELDAPIRAQPVIAAGWIYVGTADGRLIAIDTGDAALTGWPQWGRDATRVGTPLAGEAVDPS